MNLLAKSCLAWVGVVGGLLVASAFGGPVGLVCLVGATVIVSASWLASLALTVVLLYKNHSQ